MGGKMQSDVCVVYDGRPGGLVFPVGDRKLQTVEIRNGSAQQTLLFKIQCTASRKFRVRPSLAMVAPAASAFVRIQLAAQECEASQAKLLLVVRRVDEQPPAVSTMATTAQQEQEKEEEQEAMEKAMWKRAEAQQQDSLVWTETINVRVVLEPAGSVEASGSPPPPLVQVEAQGGPVVHPHSDATGTGPGKVVVTGLSPPVPLDSMECRAEFVVLLMKFQSKKPKNKLTGGELATLLQVRDRQPREWQTLAEYARRMRALVRQYQQQQQRPAPA